MDCYILNNYKPISNITFLCKVIERAVACHLNKYLINTSLNKTLHVGYTSGDINKSALIEMTNYTMMSIDQGKPGITSSSGFAC